MNKKFYRYLILFVSLSIGIALTVAISRNAIQYKKIPTASNFTIFERTNKEGSRAVLITPSNCASEATSEQSTLENRRTRFGQALTKKQAGDFSGIILAGMITREKAREISLKYSRDSSCVNIEPEIVLIDDVYLVTLFRRPNPFIVSNKTPDIEIGIDAFSGEYLAAIRHSGGVVRLNIDRETGAGIAGKDPEAQKYYDRAFSALKTLSLNAYYGKPEKSIHSPDMISSEEAIIQAKLYLKKTDTTWTEPPLASIVKDAYIVTFWKPNKDGLAEGELRYTSRVVIDAITGEYIAKETAK